MDTGLEVRVLYGASRQSKGRDGLRRTGHRQLSFVLADSPDGGGSDGLRTHPSGARSCCKERSARDRHEPSPGQLIPVGCWKT